MELPFVEPLPEEQTLDPADDAGWSALEQLGSRMVRDMLGMLRGVRQRPAWQPVPVDVRARLRSALPREGAGAEAVYRDFVRDVMPYPTGNIHPRFWGWVMGSGSPIAALAELLAAGMNCHLAGYEDAAALVEDQVLAWCKQMLGFPAGAGGLLVSGGSMANLVGLAVARSAKAGFDVRAEGLAGGPRFTVYTSVETHSCVRRALEVLGLGARALRTVPTDAGFRVDVRALHARIRQDRKEGLTPLCVVGSAGTVNTGAVDDLDALAAVAAEEGLWFHVDGALGAPAVLSPRLAPLLKGMERADSLAFDLHKWLHVPYDVGCVLVRSEEAQRRAFTTRPAYLAATERGLASRPGMFSDLGVELSRGFKALKVWMHLKAHGVDVLARQVDQNHDQARDLDALVRAEPELEVAAPVTLNVVCLRYVGRKGLGAEALDALNRELLCRLHESGVAVPSFTTLKGSYWVRVCITNHRTRREDLDLFVDEVLRLGRACEADLQAGRLP